MKPVRPRHDPAPRIRPARAPRAFVEAVLARARRGRRPDGPEPLEGAPVEPRSPSGLTGGAAAALGE